MTDEQDIGAELEPPQAGDSDPIGPRDSLIGTTLDGRFYIEEVLGQGGMSVVYKAKQLRVNRYVAIKTIRMQVDTHSTVAQRFMREVETLVALSHPNIVSVFDCVFGPGDQPYIIMDYLKGRSLEALLRDEGPLDLNRFARIAVQILSALEHAHKKGVIHRDVKPGNVVLIDDEMDFVKVVDFGLAKLTEENRKLTRSGELWGSPPYMSPEQALGESGDYRSDIYSLGAVMYEMLTGKDPFYESATVYELIKAHLEKMPPSFAQANPNALVPPGVEHAIGRALHKKPDERYQSVGQFQSAVVGGMAGKLNSEANEYMLRFGNQFNMAGSQSNAVFNPAGSQSNPVYNPNALPHPGGPNPNASQNRLNAAGGAGISANTTPEIPPTPAAPRRHFLDSQGGAKPPDESYARPEPKMAGSNPDLASVGRLRERQILAQPRTQWVPWALAGCSILLAVCLSVVALGLFNKVQQKDSTSPYAVRRYQARDQIQDVQGDEAADIRTNATTSGESDSASSTKPVANSQVPKQLPVTRAHTETKPRVHKDRPKVSNKPVKTASTKPLTKPTKPAARSGADPWDTLLEMRKKKE